MHFAKVIRGKAGKLDLRALYLLGNSLSSLRLFTLAAAPTLFLSLSSSRPTDQTNAAVGFWGVSLPLPLIWSASTS